MCAGGMVLFRKREDGKVRSVALSKGFYYSYAHSFLSGLKQLDRRFLTAGKEASQKIR